MKVSQMFPKKYAAGEDLQGKAVTLTVAAVRSEKMYRPTEEKEIQGYVLYFKEAKKGVVLGRTLADEVAEAVGTDEAGDWPGQRITLYTEPKNVFGEVRQVFHARKANGGAPPPATLTEDPEDQAEASD